LQNKPGVALTGRSCNDPPCSFSHPHRSWARRPAGPPAALQTTTTDASDSEESNTGPLGGPVLRAHIVTSSNCAAVFKTSDLVRRLIMKQGT